MDLAFRADGKKFSLFSGQSPVGLGGYFSQPKIDVVSDELLGRAGAGLGLALVDKLVRDMGGLVQYARENDRTVFRLLLPRATA